MPYYYIFHTTGPHINTVEARDDTHFEKIMHLYTKGYTFLKVYSSGRNSTYPNIETCDIPPETRRKILPTKKT